MVTTTTNYGTVNGVPTPPNSTDVVAAHSDGAHVYNGNDGGDVSSTGGNATYQGGAGSDTFIIQASSLAHSSGLTNGIDADAVIFGFSNAGTPWSPTNNDFVALSGFGAGSTITFAHYAHVNGADDHTDQFYTIHDTTTGNDYTIFVKSLDGQQLGAGDFHFF